jgi:hypothetical protein
MNQIAISERIGNPRFSVSIDGRALAEHFVGRLGAHPGQVFVLGWSAAASGAERETLEHLLGLRRSSLVSGRVPLLVCEECGDVACGAIAARIERNGSVVTWSDWAYENGYESAKPLEWPTYPKFLEFDLEEYERALSGVVPSG